MPAQVTLEENGHLLHYIFTDPWTMSDMDQLVPQSLGYYNAATHKINVLIDISGSRNAPPGMLRARNNPELKHPNSGKIAVVGATPVIKNIGDMLLKLTRFDRARFFDNIEPALAYLRNDIEQNREQVAGEIALDV